MSTVAAVSFGSGLQGGEVSEVAGVGGERTPSAGRTGSAGKSADTVQLSAASRIHLLKQSGSSAQQIASTLGMTEVQVDEALGITPSAGSAQAGEVAALLG